MRWPGALLRAALGTAVALGVAAPAATATTFMVDTTTDAVDATPGDSICATNDPTNGGVCTLRAAVQQANALHGPDQINVPAGKYELTLGVRGENAAVTGDLDVTEALTIAGPGAAATTIFGMGNDRIFDVRTDTLSVSGVGLESGNASGPGDDSGGAVRTAVGAIVNLDRVRAVHNGASGDGSVLDNAGTAEVRGSSIAATTSHTDNWVSSAGTLLVVNTTSSLGAIEVLGGTATIRNSTLLGDTANAVPALDITGGTATVTNSILGGASPVCAGTLPTSAGHNLVSDGSCGLTGPGDQNTVDVGLHVNDSSGDTFFFAPWAYGSSFDPPPGVSCDLPLCPRLSRAVDSADATVCPATDQIGTPRPQGPACDIGAAEAPQADLALAVTSDAASVAVGQPFTLTWTISNLGQSRVSNVLMAAQKGWPALTIVSQDLVPGPGGCHFEGVFAGFAICDLRTPLEPGASITRRMTMQADAATPDPLKFEAHAGADGSIAWPPRDPNEADNTASATVTVLAPVVQQTFVSTERVLLRGACANTPATGTRKADVLAGTPAGDRLVGFAGADRINGFAGDDCLYGGDGNDVLSGGSGNDKLKGGRGADTMKGGTGNDVIEAADHKRDTIDCGKGRDRATVDRIDRVRGCEKVTRKR